MACLALASPIGGAGDATAAQQIAKHADWTSYAHEDAGQRLCFLVSSPKQREPADAPAGDAHVFVSAWPKAGVRAEVSIAPGLPLKAGSDVVIQIDAQRWRFFIEGPRAFAGDPTQELKLIEAMKKGSRMQVEATTADGAKVVDTYSLSGLTQGLQVLASRCQ